MHKDLIAKILGVTVKSVYNYEKENRLVLNIFNNYMTDDDARELIETGKISKFENEATNTNDNELLEKHIAYELRHKLYLDTASSFGNWLGHVVGMPVIHKALEEISRSNYTKSDTKEKILNQIKGMELSGLFNKVFEKANKNVASRYIDRNLSELECYVWVKHYDIVTSYNKYWG